MRSESIIIWKVCTAKIWFQYMLKILNQTNHCDRAMVKLSLTTLDYSYCYVMRIS